MMESLEQNQNDCSVDRKAGPSTASLLRKDFARDGNSFLPYSSAAFAIEHFPYCDLSELKQVQLFLTEKLGRQPASSTPNRGKRFTRENRQSGEAPTQPRPR